VSSFLTAHRHILGYSVPENGVKNVIKEKKYNSRLFSYDKIRKTGNIVVTSINHPSVF